MPTLLPPGPFAELVRTGSIAEAELAPLLERLPDEEFVRTSARDGEAFDSRRWPLVCNARLATTLVTHLDNPLGQLRATSDVLHACAGDHTRLRLLNRQAFARSLAASGISFEELQSLVPDAGELERAVLAEPRLDPNMAELAHALVLAHFAAADGLYAYHVARGLPGPAADACARLAQVALERGLITTSELVELAIDARASVA